MYWFTENSFPVILIGLFLVGSCIGFGIILPQRRLIYAGIVFFVLTAGAVGIEQWIVTDREQLRATVGAMASAVRRNNVPELLEHVATAARGPAGSTRNRIQSEMPDYYFRGCRLGPIDIEIEPPGDKAKITFVAFVDVDATKRYGYDGFARRQVFLELEKNPDGEWKVVYFDHADPASGIRL